jgi:glycosidase
MYNYVRTLANFRKTSPALTTGKMMQYVPEDGVYVYFRYAAHQTILCVMNPENTDKQLDMHRFTERTTGFTRARDVMTGNVMDITGNMTVPAKTLLVAELE